VKRFFQDYKVLENKQVEIDDFLGAADAIRIIRESLELYRHLRRKQTGR
jgi:inorganic pyrophosphatase